MKLMRYGLLLGMVLLLGTPVSALSVYGRGNYGQCPYQQDCPTAPSQPGEPTPSAPTIVTTPSKLEVAVNLTEGQTIPSSGYTILITPLNGQGRSYETASITIDGVQVYEGPPGANGTGQYQWQPAGPGSYVVVVRITDDTGEVTTLTFNVRVTTEGAATPQEEDKPTPAPLPGALSIFQGLDDNLRQLFEQLSPGVVRAISYLLLLLALLIIALLLFQLRREIAYQNALAVLARRRQMVANDRQTFIGLVSHFLRTPLTTINGGLDLLRATDKPLADRMNVFAENVRLNTEKLLSDLSNVTVPAPAVLQPAKWHRLTLWLPLAAIGLLLAVLSVLRIRYQVEANAWGDSIIQILLFITIVVVAWIMARHLQLRRRERLESQATDAYQAQLGAARDQIVREAVAIIRGDVKSLSTTVLPEVAAAKFVRQGITDLNALITKLAMAEHAKEGINPGAPQPTLVASLLPDSSSEHPLQVRGGDQPFGLMRPDLLKYVLYSLVNNAVAYSHEGQPVTVDITPRKITIVNKGDYLSEEVQQLLFKPFSRAEGALNFTHAGMGFELYLNRLIMRSLGGEVEFHSSTDGTNTAVIVLPS